MKSSVARKSLAGKTLVVTRALTQAGRLSGQLKELGAAVIEYPCIDIAPLPGLLEKFQNLKEFSTITDVIFTSENGVRVFFQCCDALGKKTSLLKNKTLIAVGPKTNAILEEYGFSAALIPSKFQAEGILDALPNNLQGRLFLLPRARGARDLLPREIQKRGGRALDFPLYESVPPKALKPLAEKTDGICFTSSKTVLHYALANPVRPTDRAFVIGEVTAKSARDAGFKKVFVAGKATLENLVETIQETFSLPLKPE